MRTVYKYNITSGFTKLTLPKRSKIFSANLDGMTMPSVWAAVDTEEAEIEERLVYLTGTGWPIEDLNEGWAYRFIDTIVEADTGLVWHVFEVVAEGGCRCQSLQ